jgi:hypothetical protein
MAAMKTGPVARKKTKMVTSAKRRRESANVVE